MKTAVVLLNLGGPDRPESVKRFLFNLFNDPLIIRLPGFLRTPLAWLISTRRNKEAQAIYSEIGGKSPILEITTAQAEALSTKLAAHGMDNQVFVSMRYWHPMTDEVVQKVKAYNPDHVFLLPLYPQYSTTTSKSSLDVWLKESKKQNLKVPTKYACCYPTNKKLIEAHSQLIQKQILEVKNKKIRILFSAHSLPVSIIKSGDPYQWQVQQTVLSIMNGINGAEDHVLCYQSKVTPVKWLEPSTPDEIKKAVQDDVAIIIVPIAFVSDHSETLVELDIEYKNLAEEMGSKDYYRIEALNINEMFIEGLKDLVLESQEVRVTKNISAKICPKTFKECYHNFNE
tara:strand:+ start:283 stop:1308 length:1026 start_codon:yes stop_codon:yes gene_type:complete